MSTMGTKGPSLLAALLLAGLTGAAHASATVEADGHPPGASSPLERAAAERAIVSVAAPELPAGRSAAARERWHRLRAAAARRLGRLAERNDLSLAGKVPETGQLVVELGDETLAGLRARLAAEPALVRVERDRPVEWRYAPNDPSFNQADGNAPFGDRAQWNLLRSNAVPAWDDSRGAGAEVAVIDTGVDVTHPELAGRVVARADCTTAGCSGTDVSDGEGHGTHVAGLACADSDNGLALASLGFDCDLFAVQLALCSEAPAAITAAANRLSDAINMSFGGCGSSLGPAISYAWNRGSVPVAAGTNTPTPGGSNYPAQAIQPEGSGPTIDSGRGLVVTAVKHSGDRAVIAQRTTGVSVAGYGFATDQVGGMRGILSTWPDATTRYDTGDLLEGIPPCGCRTAVNGDDRYAYLSGTSMATPQVSGLVALMRAAKPGLTAPRLVKLIKLTATNCGQYANGIGWGVIDARQAVAAALDRDVAPPHSSVTKATRRRLVVKRSEGGCSAELPTAGVKKVAVFASANGGPYRKVGKARGKSLRFRPKPKRRYRFYSVAVDNAGNREAPPEGPDAKLRVGKRRR